MMHGKANFAEDGNATSSALTCRVVYACLCYSSWKKSYLYSVQDEGREASVKPRIVVVALMHQIQQRWLLFRSTCDLEKSSGIDDFVNQVQLISF